MEDDYDWAVCQNPECEWEGPADDVEFAGTNGDECPNCRAEPIQYCWVDDPE